MDNQNPINIRLANEKDQNELANIIHFEKYIHRHLDWYSPLDWIGKYPFLVAEQRGSIISALAAPPDPCCVAWIRLFAVVEQIPRFDVWERLLSDTIVRLHEMQGTKSIAAIAIQDWFGHLLQSSGFSNTQEVILLEWKPESLSTNDLIGTNIHPMDMSEIDQIMSVDAESFEPIWQNSRETMEKAYETAVYCTVIKDGSSIVGYQISSATPMGGHLARLAIRPEFQRQGLGRALVQDTQNYFYQQKAKQVTVNTQSDNPSSMALYEDAGFRKTGEAYPLFQYFINT